MEEWYASQIPFFLVQHSSENFYCMLCNDFFPANVPMSQFHCTNICSVAKVGVPSRDSVSGQTQFVIGVGVRLNCSVIRSLTVIQPHVIELILDINHSSLLKHNLYKHNRSSTNKEPVRGNLLLRLTVYDASALITPLPYSHRRTQPYKIHLQVHWHQHLTNVSGSLEPVYFSNLCSFSSVILLYSSKL